jgi:hypothetical protein
MAKIPEELIKRKQRTVNDLQPGERAKLALCMITVDYDRNAFVFANAELGPPLDDELEYGDIWLDDQGKYHVDLKDTRRVWQPRDITLFRRNEEYGVKPIESIVWSPNSDASLRPESNRD